jgi:hypothetical protein
MGVNQCTCTRENSADDFIYSIFDTMNLKKLDVKYVYKDFISCIQTPKETTLNNSNKSEKSYLKQKLNEKSFTSFILKIVSNKEHQAAQLSFFRAIFYLSRNNTDVIKRIGAFIILNADGSYLDKLSLLHEHVGKYYGNSERRIKEFVNDMVLMNTEICLVALENNIDKETYDKLENMWKKPRLEKYIDDLFTKYEQDYCNSTRPSYFKHIVDEKNEGVSPMITSDRWATPGKTLGSYNEIMNMNTNEKFNIVKTEGNQNNTPIFNKYLSNFIFELQGDKIRSYIHAIYISESKNGLS